MERERSARGGDEVVGEGRVAKTEEGRLRCEGRALLLLCILLRGSCDEE